MSENAFGRLHTQEAITEGEIRDRQLKFEHERTRWMLQQFNLQKYTNSLRLAGTSIYNRNELRFAMFNNTFSTFPFLLGASILCGMPVNRGGKTTNLPSSYAVFRDPDSTEPARFKNFGNVPFVMAYSSFYDSVASERETRKIGLVFPRKGFLHGMIIHNDESEMYWSSGLCWVYKSLTDKKDRRLYVQPFSSVVDAIRKSGWRHE